MATLATQSIRRSGLASTYAAAAGGGDRFTPDRGTFLHIKNASGAPITVTVVTPRQALLDVEIVDLAVAVPAAGERMIGPFPAEHFGSLADGLADITYSGVTTLTVGVFNLTAP